MPITDMIPWRRRERTEPERTDPVTSMQRLQTSMNRWFDSFFENAGLAPFERMGERWDVYGPRVDIEETDDAFEVTVEVPGLDKDDIDVSISDTMLTVAGKTSGQREERRRNVYRMERSYGAFTRTIPLPDEINPDKAEASLEKGLLVLTLPKTEQARKRKKISVKRA